MTGCYKQDQKSELILHQQAFRALFALRSWLGLCAMAGQRQATETCIVESEFSTPYDEEDTSLAYMGIMFDIRNGPEKITVETLEIDVRSEKASDLHVEVYTMIGNFELSFSKADEWKLSANTTAALASEESGGIIIQKRDFRSFVVEPHERRSFYVTMRGRWIKYTADAFQRTGDLANEGEHFDVHTGAGIAHEKFPSQLDDTVSPKFAGVIHYKVETSNCATQPPQLMLPTTQAKYDVIIRQDVADDDLSNIGEVVDHAVNKALADSGSLIDYVSQYKLGQSGKAKAAFAWSGDFRDPSCPESWLSCSSVSAQVSFQHTADGERILIPALYSLHEEIANAIKDALSADVIYIGYRDVSATFEMTLHGVPLLSTMTGLQEQYFGNTTGDLLSRQIKDSTGIVFFVDEQTPIDPRVNLRHGRTLYTQEDGVLTLVGRVMGAQLASSATEFVDAVQQTLEEREALLVSTLSKSFLNLELSQKDEDELQYFAEMTSIESKIAKFAPTTLPVGSVNEGPQPDTVGDTINDVAGDMIDDVNDVTGKATDIVSDNVDTGSPAFTIILCLIAFIIAVSASCFFLLARYRNSRLVNSLKGMLREGTFTSDSKGEESKDGESSTMDKSVEEQPQSSPTSEKKKERESSPAVGRTRSMQTRGKAPPQTPNRSKSMRPASSSAPTTPGRGKLQGLPNVPFSPHNGQGDASPGPPRRTSSFESPKPTRTQSRAALFDGPASPRKGPQRPNMSAAKSTMNFGTSSVSRTTVASTPPSRTRSLDPSSPLDGVAAATPRKGKRSSTLSLHQSQSLRSNLQAPQTCPSRRRVLEVNKNDFAPRTPQRSVSSHTGSGSNRQSHGNTSTTPARRLDKSVHQSLLKLPERSYSNSSDGSRGKGSGLGDPTRPNVRQLQGSTSTAPTRRLDESVQQSLLKLPERSHSSSNSDRSGESGNGYNSVNGGGSRDRLSQSARPTRSIDNKINNKNNNNNSSNELLSRSMRPTRSIDKTINNDDRSLQRPIRSIDNNNSNGQVRNNVPAASTSKAARPNLMRSSSCDPETLGSPARKGRRPIGRGMEGTQQQQQQQQQQSNLSFRVPPKRSVSDSVPGAKHKRQVAAEPLSRSVRPTRTIDNTAVKVKSVREFEDVPRRREIRKEID